MEYLGMDSTGPLHSLPSYLAFLVVSAVLEVRPPPSSPPPTSASLTALTFTALQDFYFYWVHRGLHHRSVYKYCPPTTKPKQNQHPKPTTFQLPPTLNNLSTAPPTPPPLPPHGHCRHIHKIHHEHKAPFGIAAESVAPPPNNNRNDFQFHPHPLPLTYACFLRQPLPSVLRANPSRCCAVCAAGKQV
jgi:hypothetical protein